MATFKDNHNRSWQVDITISSLKRIKSLISVDLGDIFDAKKNLMSRLQTDPILLVDVIYCIIKPQADKLGITDEQFGEAMAGDSIQGAADAFTESLVLFRQSPIERANLKRLFEAQKKMMTKALDYQTSQVDKLLSDKALDNLMSKAISEQKISGDLSTNAQA